MKLNNRRTVLIGFAFLSICAFWQLYDTVIPLILRDTFRIGDARAGQIMALDNVLALFLLPWFGRLSDRCNSRMGRRMPFIVFGTIAAVALMPDVTPKPLRSKANAIINLMGALGGVFALAVIRLLPAAAEGARVNYFPAFAAVAALMALSVALVAGRVSERALRAEMPPEPEEETAPGGRLPRELRTSLILILCSVALWYMGYNAVTTAYSKYFTRKWGDLSGAASCLMIATAGAVVSYIPVGMLSSKVGRKKMILLGVCVLTACFALAGTVQTFSPLVYALFVLIGFAWAAINVNSYPMAVEISQSGDVGKYTGYYYTFSMAAQIVTPIASGWLLEHVGYHTLFPYAAAMTGAAFFTMLFVRHGDSRPEAAKSVLEHFDAAD